MIETCPTLLYTTRYPPVHACRLPILRQEIDYFEEHHHVVIALPVIGPQPLYPITNTLKRYSNSKRNPFEVMCYEFRLHPQPDADEPPRSAVPHRQADERLP